MLKLNRHGKQNASKGPDYFFDCWHHNKRYCVFNIHRLGCQRMAKKIVSWVG